MVQKVCVTSEQLKKWLMENGVKLSGLEMEMGVAQPYLSSFFNKTTKGRKGGIRYFTPVVTEKLNTAMHQVAERLRGMLVSVNPEEAVIVCKNRLYYPVVLERMQPLRTYIMLKAFMYKSLGWSPSLTSSKLLNQAHSSYGRISIEDINGINTGILQLAAALDSFQMVPDALSANAGDKREKLKEKNNSQLDDDPVLSQWHSVKEQYPNSVVIFRHGGMYVTVADDAELIARLTHLKVEHHEGTALCVFLNTDLETVLPCLVNQELRVVFEDLKES